MKVLLVQSDCEARDKIHFILESNFYFKVDNITLEEFTAKNPGGPGARADFDYDLIILDTEGQSPIGIKDLFGGNTKTPTVLYCPLGKEDSYRVQKNVVATLDRLKTVELTAPIITQLIQQGVIKSVSKDQLYCRIRTKLLLPIIPLKADIYIRLSEAKYIKLFREGDTFNQEDLEKYTLKKGIEYLFLRGDQTTEFLEKYVKDIKKLLAAPPQTVDQLVVQAESTFETIQELGNRLGFKGEVQAIAKAQVQLTLKAVGNSPKLSQFLDKFRDKEGLYNPYHSTVTAFLSCAIASKLQWGSELTFHKLNLAALLHDITLENQKLAACENIEELEFQGAQFTAEEIRAFKAHPIESASITQQFTEVPPDVDTIILQHHEIPNGTGFPRKLSHTYISPLAAVFITAHQMCKELIAKKDDFIIKDFIDQVKEKFPGGQFKKVHAVLKLL